MTTTREPPATEPYDPAADQVTPPPAPAPALSDLSVTEFLTLSRAGFLPRGLVIGVAVCDGGVEAPAMELVRERVQSGNAMRAARRLAVARLRAQAQALGAEGVVGVRLSVEHHRWRNGHTVARLVAVGTAIVFDAAHAPPELRGAPSLHLADGPFTSNLSGQEFVTLLQAGYRPIAIALGNCIYELLRLPAASLAQIGNAEIVDFSMALMGARETAMQRLEEDLEAEHRGADAAEGVVGVRVEERIERAGGEGEPDSEGEPMLRMVLNGMQFNLVEYTAVGTAIASLHPSDPRRAPAATTPAVVVPLDR
jgi:uncharacterized protein YbjQ (UPF0145 family)